MNSNVDFDLCQTDPNTYLDCTSNDGNQNLVTDEQNGAIFGQSSGHNLHLDRAPILATKVISWSH
jgi:hypothetical protein